MSAYLLSHSIEYDYFGALRAAVYRNNIISLFTHHSVPMLGLAHQVSAVDGECKRVVNECVNTWGSIDILVNCAGICINERDVTKYGREQWDKMVSVNLTAAFEMIHESCKYMIEQKSGKIINIASLFSFLGGQWSPAYASTKHGIVGLTKAMCDELAQWNIQVNAIAPGYFATPLTEMKRKDEKLNAEIISHIPANRWGRPADLMGAMVFLSCAASDYVNGTVLTVDGGYLMR